MRLIKPKSETENDKLPQGEKVLQPKKQQDIWHTIAQMTQDLQQTAEYALDICEEMNVSIIATHAGRSYPVVKPSYLSTFGIL